MSGYENERCRKKREGNKKAMVEYDLEYYEDCW